RRMPAPLFLRQHVHLRLELGVRRDRLRLAHHHPPLQVFLLHPPPHQPDVVPPDRLVHRPAEHLHPPHHPVPRRPQPPHTPAPPTVPPPSPSPRSPRPVPTVPRPEIENTSSTAISSGLSTSRCGVGMYVSTASISFRMHSFALASLPPPSIACFAEPRTIG